MTEILKNEKFIVYCFKVGDIATNCYVVIDLKEKQAAIIDPGFYTDELCDFINKNDIKPLIIILTHGHFDHFLGVNKLSPKKTYIHKDDEEILENPNKNAGFLAGILNFNKIENLKTIEDGYEIDFIDEKFKTIHTKGHTNGSCCFVFQNMLFTGDTIFKEGVGRCDLYGGDSESIKKSIKKIAELQKNYIVLPGHGPFTTLNFIKQTNHFFNSFNTLPCLI